MYDLLYPRLSERRRLRCDKGWGTDACAIPCRFRVSRARKEAIAAIRFGRGRPATWSRWTPLGRSKPAGPPVVPSLMVC